MSKAKDFDKYKIKEPNITRLEPKRFDQ